MMTYLTDAEELKLRLLVEGVNFSQSVRDNLTEEWGDSALSLADYATTNGITLKLDGEIWVNAPIIDHNPNFVDSPEHELFWEDGQFIVRSGELEAKATPIPLPGYHKETNKWGEPYVKYVHSHADRVRASPIAGCSFNCKFCDMSYTLKYWKKPIDRIIDALQRAFDDSQLPVNHALISGGTPKPEDIDRQRMVYKELIAAFPQYDFEIMLSPLKNLLEVPYLKSIGAKGLAINMELFSDQALKNFSPKKHRIGRKMLLNSIEDAVIAFGQGQVRSLLLVGLENMEQTLDGVEEIAKRGCDPVLSAFRPAPGTPLEKIKPPTVDYVRETFLRSRDIVVKYPGVELGPRCIPCKHNSVAV